MNEGRTRNAMLLGAIAAAVAADEAARIGRPHPVKGPGPNSPTEKRRARMVKVSQRAARKVVSARTKARMKHKKEIRQRRAR